MSIATDPAQPTVTHHGVSFGEAMKVWARVAALSFGGPAGQIAMMHRILVEEKRWLGERRFLHALNYCMLLPGPEAQQLAIYIGWLMHGTAGGLLAGVLFMLPGFLAIMGLSILHALLGGVGMVSALFFGLKAAVLAIVLQAVVRVGKRSLKNPVMIGIAAAGTRSTIGELPPAYRVGPLRESSKPCSNTTGNRVPGGRLGRGLSAR